MGSQLIWVMGNHDEREPFSSVLLRAEPSLEPQDRVYDVNGLRIIALDSTVPGYHHGELTDAQLEWLRDELATPAQDGTILALHHPPLPSSVEIMAIIELYDQPKLADVIRGTDVRGILAGHYHYSSFGSFAGIPVSVAGATCYTIDVSADPGNLRGVDGAQSVNLVHFFDDAVVHSIVPIGDAAAGGRILGGRARRARRDEPGSATRGVLEQALDLQCHRFRRERPLRRLIGRRRVCRRGPGAPRNRSLARRVTMDA